MIGSSYNSTMSHITLASKRLQFNPFDYQEKTESIFSTTLRLHIIISMNSKCHELTHNQIFVELKSVIFFPYPEIRMCLPLCYVNEFYLLRFVAKLRRSQLFLFLCQVQCNFTLFAMDPLFNSCL